MVEYPTVTERMRTLINSLRVVIAMFGFNIGLIYACVALGHTDLLGAPLIGAFICLCAWLAVEWQIRRERNVER